MGKIPEQFLDELVDRTDIVALIDQRVPLQRAGHEYRACCPFHNEKTPSFYVSPQKQFYHCFGCGAHGTAIGFLMNYDNMDFRDAIEELASRVNMTIPEEARAAPTNPETPALIELSEKAKRWFQQQLRQHPEAEAARHYLKERGLSGEVAAQFALGFAPDQWDGLLVALGQRPDVQQQLAKIGLLINKDGRYYDRFRGRIIFPIHDQRGRSIGFGGRIIDQGEPKYLNSPETPLFHKGAELYNFDRARRAIGHSGYSLVVEGYMDVIGLAQFEVDNVVATLGTATTIIHLQRLFRAAPKIVLCFDGDRAGRQAAGRAMETALPELRDGRQINILLLPEGDDPDSLIRKIGKDAFLQRLKDATPLSGFLFDSVSEALDLEHPEGRAMLAQRALPLIEKIPNGAFKELIEQSLADRVGVDFSSLRSGSPNTPATPSPSPPAHNRQHPGWVRNAITLLIQNPSLAEDIQPESISQAHAPKGASLLFALIAFFQKYPKLTTAQALERLRNTPHHPHLEKLAATPHNYEESVQAQTLKDWLQAIHDETLENQIQELLSISATRTLEEHEKESLKTLLNTRKITG